MKSITMVLILSSLGLAASAASAAAAAEIRCTIHKATENLEPGDLVVQDLPVPDKTPETGREWTGVALTPSAALAMACVTEQGRKLTCAFEMGEKTGDGIKYDSSTFVRVDGANGQVHASTPAYIASCRSLPVLRQLSQDEMRFCDDFFGGIKDGGVLQITRPACIYHLQTLPRELTRAELNRCSRERWAYFDYRLQCAISTVRSGT